jgi:hypothetical protein
MRKVECDTIIIIIIIIIVSPLVHPYLWVLLLLLLLQPPRNSFADRILLDQGCLATPVFHKSKRTTMTAPETISDSDLIEQAAVLYKEERLLAAARLLRQVQEDASLTQFHQRLLHNAEICEKAVTELLSEPSSDGWKKQGESHGHYDTSIYYKVEPGARLTCRMETPIPSSLLVPLLSVLNESNLYTEWIPRWTYPFKMGVSQSHQLIQETRGHQIIQIQCDVPWPITPREVLMDVIAVDDIDEQGFIIAKMRTLEANTQELPPGFSIPPLAKNTERIDFDGAVLFRPCPTDHANYATSREKNTEDLILLQFTMYFDAHMAMVPQSVINFITRTVIGHIWGMLLKVAEEVRDGKRPIHAEIIEAKADFYKWVNERTQFMLAEIKATADKKQAAAAAPEETDGTWTMEEVLAINA